MLFDAVVPSFFAFFASRRVRPDGRDHNWPALVHGAEETMYSLCKLDNDRFVMLHLVSLMVNYHSTVEGFCGFRETLVSDNLCFKHVVKVKWCV